MLKVCLNRSGLSAHGQLHYRRSTAECPQTQVSKIINLFIFKTWLSSYHIFRLICSCQLVNMDDDSLVVALEIQIRDLSDVIDGHDPKGKNAVDKQLPDDIKAATEQRALFENRLAEIKNWRFTRSINEALNRDRRELDAIIDEEECAIRDRRMARELSGQRGPSSSSQSVQQIEADFLERFDALKLKEAEKGNETRPDSIDSHVDTSTGESSRWAASRKQKAVLQECTVCGDARETTRLECPPQPGEAPHQYCGPCIKRLFESAMVDESLFPPRCCRTEIPISLVRHVLSDDTISRFGAKRIEFSSADRTYCSNPQCRVFLAPSTVQHNVASCPQCSHRTCTVCKSTEHKGECPADPALQETLDLAKHEGWQQCSGCQRVIQLSTGCNHIT